MYLLEYHQMKQVFHVAIQVHVHLYNIAYYTHTSPSREEDCNHDIPSGDPDVTREHQR